MYAIESLKYKDHYVTEGEVFGRLTLMYTPSIKKATEFESLDLVEKKIKELEKERSLINKFKIVAI